MPMVYFENETKSSPAIYSGNRFVSSRFVCAKSVVIKFGIFFPATDETWDREGAIN